MRTLVIAGFAGVVVVMACNIAASRPTPTSPPLSTPSPTSAQPSSRATPTLVPTGSPLAPTPPSPIANDEGVFLRVIAALDEARGYCLDIPGHLNSVRIDSPLQVHTCKQGIWNQDGRFELAGLGNGVIRMPHYDLCLQAENNSSWFLIGRDRVRHVRKTVSMSGRTGTPTEAVDRPGRWITPEP
jgi:hypothetical protein